jgi:hypothetical protein
MALALAAPSFAEKTKPADPAEITKSDAAHPADRAPEKAEPSTRIVAQREAMKTLPLVDGEWRGPSRKKSRESRLAQGESETYLEFSIKRVTGGTRTRQRARDFMVVSSEPGHLVANRRERRANLGCGGPFEGFCSRFDSAERGVCSVNG